MRRTVLGFPNAASEYDPKAHGTSKLTADNAPDFCRSYIGGRCKVFGD